MYSQAEWPPLDTFPAYLGVAMVTMGGLVTCSIIMVACTYCSFLRKFRAGGNDGGSGMPSGSYVEGFYANPAFINLPFDGSNTDPKYFSYDESVLTVNSNHHPSMDKTTSIYPSTAPEENPQTVVAKVTGPAPYQMEPRYCVQSNSHLSLTANRGNSAIDGETNISSNESYWEMQGNVPKLKENFSLDVVFANQGAAGSFREQENGSEVLKSIENLQIERQNSSMSQHSSADGMISSPKGDVSKHVHLHHGNGEVASFQSHRRTSENGDGVGENADAQEGRNSGGTWNKRVRQSFDDPYVAKNSPSQQPIKKLKLANSDLSSNDLKRISRKGSRAKRKIRTSFSKVQKPVFRPRRRVAETQQATEIIQNPFVV